MPKRLKPALFMDCASRGTRACRGCDDRTECDLCGRPLCYLVHVEVDDEVLCPACARNLGATDDDIYQGRLDFYDAFGGQRDA